MCEKTLKRSITLLAVLALQSSALAVEFAGGTGEPNDPYQIATAEQLVSIGSDSTLMDKHFVLLNDIDLDPNLPGEQVFDGAVIGRTSPSLFEGTLDGNGHRILNLTIQSTWHVGLIRRIGSEGRVCDLGLVGVYISGTKGGALAVTNNGSIQGCYASGTVSGHSDLGGLVGENRGSITDCYSTCSMTGDGRIGGLVGFSYRGGISLSYATGLVTGGDRVGGLIGEAWSTAVIQCYASGAVMGSRGVGGLIGRSSSNSVTYCYATGSVTGDSYVGGLVGDLWFASMGWCYASGAVTGGDRVGGLVGGVAEFAKGPVESSFFLSAEAGGGPDNGYGTVLTLAEMSQESSFLGWGGFYGVGGDGPDSYWFMPSGRAPVLTWQTDVTGLIALPATAGLPWNEAESALKNAGFVVGTVDYDYDRTVPPNHVVLIRPAAYAPAGSIVDIVLCNGSYNWHGNAGSGSPEEPYQITSPGQLESLADNPDLWDKHFVLENEIDLAGRMYRTTLIAADAKTTGQDYQGASFTGSFDGNGLAIRHLTIEPDGSPYQGYLRDSFGLFGKVGPAGDIRNLRLADVKISMSRAGARFTGQIGSLAAENEGTISYCSVTGSIVGGGRGRHIGALVGVNRGNIDNSFSGPGMVVGDAEVGGLVGDNHEGTIADCYSIMSVEGEREVGGLVGRNGGGTLLSCYAAGLVVTAQQIVSSGGLVGASGPTVRVTASYFLSPLDGGGPDNGIGTALTDQQMKQQTSFAEWDFGNTWTICEGDYPKLRWEGEDCGDQ